MRKRGKTPLWIALLLTLTAVLPVEFSEAKGGTERPSWIDEPGDGVVGYSGYHVKGRAEQEALAVSRARTELAARLGVTVSGTHTIHQTVTNDRTAVRSDLNAELKVRDVVVHARVRSRWRDPKTDEFWVLLYPEQSP